MKALLVHTGKMGGDGVARREAGKAGLTRNQGANVAGLGRGGRPAERRARMGQSTRKEDHVYNGLRMDSQRLQVFELQLVEGSGS